ncbi:MAG: NADH-quinone oxidoreductase subunit N [Deltaproteobacteria bacterium]|nr:NADH-quinone oxidoreductase subunit N [Deltaproteobacteria bacterium]
MINPPEISWIAILPVLLLSATAMLTMVADLWTDGPDREGLGWIGLVGLMATAIAAVALWNTKLTSFAGAVVVDRYGLFFTLLFCVAAGLTLLMSMSYLEQTDIRTGDYYSLILFSTVGMVVMATAADLIVVFLGLEVMSIAAYALAGIWRSQVRSNEAALKYFLLGAFATGFLLFGIALLYGVAGTTTLTGIAQTASGATAEQRTLLIAGMALMIVGFGFKVAAVPFHAWAPDVYEGAPTSVTALMAVGVKSAAFAAFARIFMHTLAVMSPDWSAVLWVLAVLTMTVGNVTALLQRNIKRMLAYSSIAHAGYLLVGMVAGGELGGSAILFYLLAYTLMTLGAFSVVIALGRRGQPNENLEDYAGAGFRSPFLGMAMSIFMLSLAGIPPFGGFVGKFYIFSAAVKSGYIGLTVIGVMNSLISVYYYVGVLVRMYMTDGGVEITQPSSRPYLFATLVVAVAGTIALGLFPSTLFEVARQSFLALG